MKRTTVLYSSCLAMIAGVVPAQEDLSPREAAFAELMTGCKMVGHFNMKGSDKPAQEESYTIAKVSKVDGDRWRFDAKIEYAGKSFNVPVTVPVIWAKDTPVISVTEMDFPLMGTYSARVVIHDNQYAGMWSGKNYGGFMFGRIERAGGDAKPEPKAGGGGGAAAAAAPVAPTGENWANWRGPSGAGIGAGNPPAEWGEDKNVRWKVALPGLGSSTPIVWGDRIYLTTAIETDVEVKPSGSDAEPEAAPPADERRGRRGRGRGRGRSRPTKMYRFAVLAIDRADGNVVWRSTVKEAVPHEAGHATGSQASASPITDGERIYAHFGSRGLHCLDMEGKVLWSKDFGQMRTRNGFGEGSSPALHGDTVVVNWDHEGDSFIAAFDKRTGEERWRRDRDEITSWTTPYILQVDGRPQVIVPATGATRAYDLESGDVVWSLAGMTTNCIPTPVYAGGLVFLMSGFRGNSLQAVRVAGAKGDLADTKHVVWSHNRGTSYVPSALLYDGFLYFLRTNSGVLSCLDAETGEPLYEGQRLGMRSVYSSPVGAAGRVYVTSREGMTKVIKLGAKYEELATNQLDDVVDASLVLVGDEIYVRGQKSLYCIAKR